MRGLVFTVVLLSVFGVSAASRAVTLSTDPALDLSQKGVALHEPAYDGREGGETIEEAFVIEQLPFTDSGATCDNVDDYDEACPYTGSTSPDVVYVYQNPQDDVVTIDLCTSQYDTKVYVYDFDNGYGFGNPYACNDDAGCGYSGYQSQITGLYLMAGCTYYIVVDGYGGDCGEYDLNIVYYWECFLECPPGAVPEGEPELVDDYVDNYNSGCGGHPEPVFQLLCADEDNELTLCCNAGNYSYEGMAYRDTDWFTLYKASDPFYASCLAEEQTYVFQLGFDPELRCGGDVTVDASILCEPCLETDLALTAEIGEEVWVWAAVSGWDDIPEYLYILTIRGLSGAATPAQETTWGAVKKMFR